MNKKYNLAQLQEAAKRRHKVTTEMPTEMPTETIRERANQAAQNIYEMTIMAQILRADFPPKRTRSYIRRHPAPKTIDFAKIAASAAGRISVPVSEDPHKSPQNPTEGHFERPPARYDNKSPYGIASEMLMEQLKRSR